MGSALTENKEGNQMKNITIAGNCTKDGELRTTPSGNKVANLSVAVNGFENGQKTSLFFDVSMWGKRGEAIMQFAKKGAKISVTGDLGTREHGGKTYLTISASDFTPMGGNQGCGQQQESSGGGYSGGGGGGTFDDEIPFACEWRI